MGSTVVMAVKGTFCHEKNLGGTKAITQEIIEEEIVQFVGAYQVFCDLQYLAIRRSRNQFGTDGGIYDIEQSGSYQLTA